MMSSWRFYIHSLSHDIKMLLCVGILLVSLFGCQAMPVAESREKPYVTKFNSSRPHVSGGTYGMDVSSYITVSDFQCLKNNGFEFVIPRAYQSTGRVDPNAVATIKNARAANIEYVDVYLFPCPRCSKSASEQVSDMVNYLGSSDYGQIWLDIEGSQYWLGSYSENQKFFAELLDAASSHKPTGVYASEYEWSSIMGSYTGGSSHQLWYPHYDDSPSFSDFQPFGGWSRPAIKQYYGDASVCGVDVDKDWY